jgi:predicted histone-like DNA-binding protein
MKYKVIERYNPRQPEAPRKWYASPVNSGKLTLKDFAKEIAGRSSLTRGDIENTLNNFMEELPTFLKLGLSVQLGTFGTVRLSLSSEGASVPGEFNAGMIKGVKVIFTPGAELKKALEETTFEN